MKPHDINNRGVYAARTIGQGYAGLKKFCGMLNLPKPMTNNNFDLISNTFSVAAKEVAEKSMLDAANELDMVMIVFQISVYPLMASGREGGLFLLMGLLLQFQWIMAKLLIMQRYCKPCQ